MRIRNLVAPLVVLATWLAAAGAQPTQASRRELVGVIRDPRGAPIEGATVGIKGTSAQTNARGSFQLWTGEVDTLTITIRRLGYYPVEAQIAARNRAWDTVLVEMERNAQELAGVNIVEAAKRRATGFREFEDRRRLGVGQFVTREEIVAHNTSNASDLVVAKRGVQLAKIGPGKFGVRFSLYSGHRRSCIPDFWLDGQRLRGMEIDDLIPSEIQGIELYESMSTVPLQFQSVGPQPPCGTIVVWTRVPG